MPNQSPPPSSSPWQLHHPWFLHSSSHDHSLRSLHSFPQHDPFSSPDLPDSSIVPADQGKSFLSDHNSTINSKMGSSTSFDPSFPMLSTIKLEESAAKVSLPSSIYPSTPGALSAHAAVGVGAKKVSKRRSRAINKPPITVLSADTSNFRDMVQKLTGIPASPSLQSNGFQLWNSSSAGFASFLKPHLTRPSQSIQGLPTLDTSSAFLLLNGGSSLAQSRMLQNENFSQDFSTHNPFLHSSQPDGTNGSFNANSLSELALNRVQLGSGMNIDLKSWFANHLDRLKQSPPDQNTSTAPILGDPTDGEGMERTGERIFAERLREILNGTGNSPMDKMTMQVTQATENLNGKQARNLESLLMGSNRLEMEFPSRTQHTVDSWLSCDGIHATPKMELAHSA